MTRSLSIVLNGIELRGRCGVTAQERAIGQTLSIDVRLDPQPRGAGQSDELEDTVNYSQIVNYVRGVVEGGEFKLLERLATVLCDGLWDEFDPVTRRGGRQQDRAARGAARARGARRGGTHLLTGASGKRAFVSLGSNRGDRAGYLAAAREALSALPGTVVVAASRLYETAPQDLEGQDAFLNQVLCLETGLQPLDLLHECQRIEREHGRTRELRFGPRTLDIDILLFQDAESDDPELTLPHPRMVKRAFVLVPLAEVWDHARGMTDLDVDALGRETSRVQQVRLYDATEG